MLNEKQNEQLVKQLLAHQNDRYEIDLEVAQGFVLKDFTVYKEVLRPEGMAALYFSSWLFYNNGLYENKTVIDLGSGSGIQGIVCALCGAKKIIFSDISPNAFENTKENVANFDLQNIAQVYLGDLFEKIKEKADVIVFNHPFFPDFPDGDFPELTLKTMVDNTGLIHRFLEDAREHLNKDGLIIMPYFELAGPENHPMAQGEKHGYDVRLACRIKTKKGLQKGEITVYILSRPNRKV